MRKRATPARSHRTVSPGVVAMKLRTGEGSHGKFKRSRNRAERQGTKRDLRAGNF